jgi:hypothetical protein
LTTTGTQTNPEIIYKNGMVHLFFQDNSTGDLLYRRGTIDLNLGLSENIASIGIYPNPSSDGKFTIEGSVTVGEVQNISGATVEFSVKMNNGSTILNLENAPSGLYFISTTSSNGFKSTTKVILND